MNWYRISAMIGKYLKIGFGSFNQIVNLAFWPMLDIVLWGFNSVWAQQGSNMPLSLIVLTSVTLWNCVGRGSIDFSYGVIDEIWSQNLVNLFASPLTLLEWIVALAISTFVKIIMVLTICCALSYGIYGVNIMQFGLPLIPFIISLSLAGVTLGVVTVGLLIYWGRRIDMLIWTMQWLFAPLCGVFFSIDVLPKALQAVSHYIPMTFIFESVRKLVVHEALSYSALAYNILFTFLCLIGALVFFKYMFEKSRSKGLTRLI
ncbi:MAG: ABC transporter permease [Candidatus Babeliaceae bacterium]